MEGGEKDDAAVPVSSKKMPAAKPKKQRKLSAKAAEAYTTQRKKWNYYWIVSLDTFQ
jgi:hypothetical protein